MFTGFAEAALPKEGRDKAAKPNKNVFIAGKRHNQKCFPILKLEPKWATDFLFSFISLLSISCFLISFFLFPIFSLSRFVIHLFCLLSLLPLACYLSVLLSMFVSSCLVAFVIFCVNLVSNLLFFLLCSVVSSSFLTVFLHFVFHVFVGSFLVRFFLFFLLLSPFLCHFSFKNMFVSCLFRFCHFPSVSISFHKISRFLVSFSLFSTFSKTKFLFLLTLNLIFGIPC